MCEFSLSPSCICAELCNPSWLPLLLSWAVPAVCAACSVKSYETKLAASNALNSALQKENEDLREDLEEALAQERKTESGGHIQGGAWCCAAPRLLWTLWHQLPGTPGLLNNSVG